MNRKAMAPLFLSVSLLGFVGPLAASLSGCGGNAAIMGTETGNPPGIDVQRLRLEWTEDGVELVGQAGAVSPGAEVRLRNVRSGASATGTASADGSIRLSVQGDLSDPYEVTVSSGGEQSTTPLSAVNANMMSGGPASGDTSAAECLSLELELSQTVMETLTSAPSACSADADCVAAGVSVNCYYDCGQIAIARGAEAWNALALQRTAPICAALESCEREGAPSCPAIAVVPFCIAGQCDTYFGDLSCEELGNEASRRRADAMENGDRACNVDADCTLVGFGVRCFEDCGVAYAVASSAVQQVQDQVLQAESTFCGQFDTASCPPPIAPPCVPTLEEPQAVCRSSRCEVEYTER